MKNALLIFLTIYIFSGCSEDQVYKGNDFVIANGQMPNLVKDKQDNLHFIITKFLVAKLLSPDYISTINNIPGSATQ